MSSTRMYMSVEARGPCQVFFIVPHLYFSKIRLFVCYAYECFAYQECCIALNVATYRLL